MCSGAVSGSVRLSQTGLLFTKGVQIAVLLVEVGLQTCPVVGAGTSCEFSDYSGCLGYG